jgi:hypothetical protein
MKRTIALAALVLLIVSAAQAQTAYTETRNVTGFDEIGFAVSGELYITIGEGYKVVLEGDKDYITEIETKVSGDRLDIKREKWYDTGNKKVTVRVTMPSLDGISVSGSGKVYVTNPLKGDELDIAVSGSGTINLTDVDIRDVECSISGSGNLLIAGSGSVGNLEINISGSGDYKGESASIGTLEARISGSGSCDCVVRDMLRASISGSGSIYYSGNPKIDAAISGSGKVRTK